MTPDSLNQLAVISDVHGNVWALEAVLQDLARRGISSVLNLGDCLYGPLAPLAVAEILMEGDFPSVSGNEDRLLLEAPQGLNPTLDFVRSQLAERHQTWLKSLPATRILAEEFFLCHGTPDDDRTYLLREPLEQGTRPREPARIAALLKDVQQSVILCGHDHTPGQVNLPHSRLTVNPGSVGLQAYEDDQPCPHRIENASPHARYCVLTRRPGGWSVEWIALEYDWETAARTAAANGRPDWADWLRTGRAPQASKPPR